MTLFWLTISTLFAGFGLGYVKFFLLSILSGHDVSHKNWLIQVVGAIITLGPFLVVLAASPLASSIRKRFILGTTCITTFFLLAFGACTDWLGTAWWYLFASGLIMGFYLPAKNAAVPLEAKHDHRSTESVNATLNIAYLLGLLTGIPAATLLYETDYTSGVLVLLLAFFCAGLAGLLCKFPEEEPHLMPFGQAVTNSGKATRHLLTHHRLPILVSGLIWGLANAISLAITAYAELLELGNSFECSLMSVYAIVGVSIGNIYAVYLSEVRKTAVVSGLITLFLTTAMVPPFCFISLLFFSPATTYWLLASLVALLGVGFGISTNLIEGEFYRRVFAEGMEGGGGAVLSASTAFFSCILGLLVGTALHSHILGSQSQFLVLAGIVVAPLLLFLKSEDSEGWWHRLVARAIRISLRIRYKVTIKGLELVPSNGPVLILPNHPAEVDPVILGATLWKTRPLRPLMLESFYQLPLIHAVMASIRAVPIPDMEFNAGPFKLRRVHGALKSVAEALNNGDAIMMYPSGRLQRNGKELLGSASGLSKILQDSPNTPILLVRTKGLYGSNFSCAFSGAVSPDFFGAVKASIRIALENLFLLAPKRKVLIEMELAGNDFPRTAEARVMNAWLEKWYNKEGFDQLQLVPERFWSSQLKTVKQVEVLHQADVEEVPEETRLEVVNYLKEISGKEEIRVEDSLRDDLGLDSLVLTELLLWLEDTFETYDVKITDVSSVGSVMKIAAHGQAFNSEVDHSPMTHGWPSMPLSPLHVPTQNTLDACFLAMASTRLREPGLCDPLYGVMSWRKVLRLTFILSRQFRKLEDDRIGLLLPASCSASITTMALIMAKKVPVMINWTTGPRTVHQILQGAEVKRIVTARVFLDQLQTDLLELQDMFLFLEDLKSELGLADIARSWWDLQFPQYHASGASPKDTAIILFTSGSESLPKGVPLTHENFLTNIRDALSVIPLSNQDSILGFLPPFHSFGLTSSLFLPLVTGLRTAYYPNPSEARKLVRNINHWHSTIIAGTPTFLRQILQAGDKNDFSSLRIILSGAEKAPESLFQLAKGKTESAEVLEGYGITECSPIVSVNSPGQQPSGVGKLLPSVRAKIVHPDTYQEVQAGEDGLILVQGKSIFGGYLDSEKDPFHKIDSQSWYITGDLGRLVDGHLHLSGRLKRFVKVGGEMISLQAIEDCLLQLPAESAEHPLQVAVVAFEPEDGERPILGFYANINVSVDIANSFLKDHGFANIARVSKALFKEKLPLLGSGKIDIRTLQAEFKQICCSLKK
jgi:long-chain-fatty-acid--[acyl-carrier-protein] ligase